MLDWFVICRVHYPIPIIPITHSYYIPVILIIPTIIVTMNILIGITGSVATTKINELVAEIKSKTKESNIRIVATNNALKFLKDLELSAVELFTDDDEWSTWKGRGDEILHISLRNWAHLLVIAPLDANTLAKLTVGLCDNLLSTILRAWDPAKPAILCPAMNSYMWHNPLTHSQLLTAKQRGFIVIDPIEKILMCGDKGLGAMADLETITQSIKTVVDAINYHGNGNGNSDKVEESRGGN